MRTSTKFLLLSSAALVFTFNACQKETRSVPSSVSSQNKTVPSTPKAMHESGKVAIDWYNLQLRIILNANPAIPPQITGRIFGYLGIGLYESVRFGIKNSVSLSEKLYQMPAMPARENNNGYTWGISANAALANMIRDFYPGLTDANKRSIDSLENAYNDAYSIEVDEENFRRSQTFGREIAEAIFNWSKSDNDNQSAAGYVIPVFPGAWEKTPPAFAPPASPYQGDARPFLQAHTSSVAPPPAFPYSEDPSSDFYKMVKDIYDVSKTLTTEQKNIALFWNDVGVGRGFTPPGHSISILTQILNETKANLALAAEAYAKMGIGLRDALILVFRSKYQYNLIRPVTYIRKIIDPNWLPLIVTPPHPEYPAAHAYVTMAAMTAVAKLFDDNYSFVDHTYDFLGFAPRTYSSLIDAARETGNSRRYGGIHYQASINMGWTLGSIAGGDVANIQLHD